MRETTMRCTPKLRPVVLGVATVFAVAVMGCRDDVTAPDTSEQKPAFSATSQTLSFTEVSAGSEYLTCGIATDQRVYCWGTSYLGDGEAHMRLYPGPIDGGMEFRRISAGYNYACGVTTSFQAYCWGRNYAGQVGDGTTTDRLSPVAVVGGLEFRMVSAGHSDHSCGITRDDRAYCWGGNHKGQLGNGTTVGSAVPVPVAGGLTFRDISAGRRHTCGIAKPSERAYCWGMNEKGLLGTGSEVEYSPVPVEVAGGRSFRQLAVGWDHACAVTPWNVAWCWGNGSEGQIGDGNTHQRWTPRRVAGDHLFGRITAGVFHTCAETTDNRAYCWGNNTYGALGNGNSLEDRLVPGPVAGNLWFTQVDAGGFYTCGKTDANQAYCWGRNWGGQLGDGTRTDRHTPTPVADPA
jgi:alpha-tubulin suppressor-like RCC1 family protein